MAEESIPEMVQTKGGQVPLTHPPKKLPPPLTSAISSSSIKGGGGTGGSMSTPVMNPLTQFDSLITPQLPPPPLITPTQPNQQTNNLDGRRLTSITGQELTDVRKNLATDLKTPAEYTLHILFTQFVRHAERKLNVCLNNYSLESEPPIIELLSEGADKEFDKIIESLGHIARRKPKPVIDSVMFWRKSKSEVSILAASAVEKNLKTLRLEQQKINSNNNNSNNNQSSSSALIRSSSTAQHGLMKLQKQAQQQQKGLYRQSSLSFIRSHRNNNSKTSLSTEKSLSSSSQDFITSPQNNTIRSLELKLQESKMTAIQAERKSLISIYILCRVLIEVVRQTSLDVFGDDLGDKLEEIIYSQLKTTDPLLISESVIRSSNWNLFAELIGNMSEKRFLNVSDRFIADLEKVPQLVINGHENFTIKNDRKVPVASIFSENGDNDFIEESLSLLIHGMRYLKLSHYPLENFEESADFLQSIGKFFNKCQTETLIIAYCEVLNQLLLPLAGVITAEVNHPQWVEAINMIYQKLLKLLQQEPDKYWDCAINLLTTILTVSPNEIFHEHWQKLIQTNSSVLKPKVQIDDIITYVTCITRLIWIYLYRCTESLNTTHRTLDALFKLLFFNPTVMKRRWLTSDPALIEILVYLIRAVGYSSLNYTLENVILPIVKQGYGGPGLDNMIQPQLILAIRAYVCILNDFELKKRPAFPSDDVIADASHEQYIENITNLHFFNTKQPIFQKDTSNAAISEEISKVFKLIFSLLDQSVGAPTWQLNDEFADASYQHNNGSSSSSSSLLAFTSKSAFSTFLHGKDVQVENQKSLNTELFAILFEAAPFISENMPVKKLVEILVRNAVHHDIRISSAAIVSLKTMTVKKNPKVLITVFARYAFQLDDNPKQTYNVEFLTSSEYLKLLKLYVDLLVCWLNSLRYRLNSLQQLKDDAAVPIAGHPLLLTKINNEIPQVESDKISDELELKNIATIIEEVEGNGLFFLCSQDLSIRGLGLQILRIISQFDDVIYDISTLHNKLEQPLSAEQQADDQKKHKRTPSKFVAEFGTRLIQVLENIDFFEVISPLENEISLPERARLKELKLRRKKNVLIYLARSDYGIDSTLWFKAFPTILKIIFAKCAIPIALCRSVVCIRLVQMYDIIFDYANGNSLQKTSTKASSGQNQSHQSSLSTSSFFSSFSSTTTQVSNEAPGKVVGSQMRLTYSHNSHPELLVEQWRIYLIFATSTLTSTNDQKLHIPSPSVSSINGSGGFSKSHLRKKSQQVFTVQHQKITSAKSIFKMVIPLLSTQQAIVRDAVVASLSSININIFKSFIESIIPIMESWGGDNTTKSQWNDKIRIEVARALNNITSRFLNSTQAYFDDWVLLNLVTIIKHLKSFLSTPSVQIDFQFQRLRRYFSGILENVLTVILKSSNPEKWFQFEARVSCFSFLEDWCGYGRTEAVAEERYRIIEKKVAATKNSISLSATINLERSALQYSAISCMAKICGQPITKVVEEDNRSVTMSFDKQGLLEWTHALFNSSDDKILSLAKKALLNILTVNVESDEIYMDVINQCYSIYNNPKTMEAYFLTMSESLLKLNKIPVKGYQILTWCFFAVGNDNYNIRVAASKLLKHTEKILYNTTSMEALSERLCSKSKSVYKSGLFHVAAVFSKDSQIISELTRVFHIVGPESRKDILSALLPFLNSVELTMDENNLSDEVTQMVMFNLFEITIKYSDSMQNEVEGLWVALANGSTYNNVKPIMNFITMNCLQRRNPHLVQYARQIVVYLSNTPAGSILIGEFISNLEPKYMVPPQQIELLEEFSAKDMPYIASIWDSLAYTGKEAIFSLGQLSVIFLADLLISPPDVLQKKLPLLLHVAFVLLDHYLPLVQDVACEMLMRLIHNLAIEDSKALDIVEVLRKHDIKTLWVYDDLNSDKNGARTPSTMDALIRDVLKVLSTKFPSLQEEWSRVSLSWATTCAVRHIACRSFQVFRSLLSFLDQSMLRDMLHRLSNTISDETPDIQGFAMQILMTLNAVTAELDALQLIDFPQLFWSSVACLSSVHEQEYIEVLSTLSKFVSKIDLDSELTVSCLTSTFPPKWEGKFDGLQQIVMIGLRSSNSWEYSLRLLDRLNKLHDSQIIGSGDSRLLLALLSNLPRYLHALETNNYSEDVIDSAETICEMVNRIGTNENSLNDRSALKRILESFIKRRFRTKQDFLNETVNKIVKYFFPEFEAQTLVFLLGILSNNIKWVKVETMELLEKIFPWVDLQREEFIGVGADLISPLLRLLLTDYAEQALKVLDEAVSISGSQLDKDVLRISLGNKTIRKEYEKTATLFGIPDESGWAIPMPAVTAATTRNNVHSVFSTCTTATNNAEAELLNTTTNVEFHREEYSHAPNSGDFGESLSAVESHNQYQVQQQDPSLSHIYAALVNLDSFFADDEDKAAIPGHLGNSHQYNSSIDTKESTTEPIIPFESAPQVYDKKVSAILNRSLARTPSNTSFKTSLADSFGSSPTMLTEQYIHRDHNSQSLSQRTSYMSFKSNRSSSRKQGIAMPNSSMMTNSVTDLTKAEERSPHRSPHRTSPLVSQPTRHIDSPFQFNEVSLQSHQLQQYQEQQTSQKTQLQQLQQQQGSFPLQHVTHQLQQHQQQHNQSPLESSFRFEGILRNSNKSRRRSGKVHSGSPNVSGVTNGSALVTDSALSMNGSASVIPSPSAIRSTPKNSNRSSVFSRSSKKNSPKFTLSRDIQ